MNFIYIILTVLFTVYGQLVIKWRIGLYGTLPEDYLGKLNFLSHLLLDPYIISGLLAAFIAALSWMAAMTKFELSYAYPFTAISFVLIMIFSYLLFREPLTISKLLGTGLVVAGLIVGSR